MSTLKHRASGASSMTDQRHHQSDGPRSPVSPTNGQLTVRAPSVHQFAFDPLGPLRMFELESDAQNYGVQMRPRPGWQC